MAPTSILTGQPASNSVEAAHFPVGVDLRFLPHDRSPVSFSPMCTPIFPLTFIFVAFVGKQPEDKSSCADAQCDRNQDYDDGHSEPAGYVGTECIVFEPVHKNPPQSIGDIENGRDRTSGVKNGMQEPNPARVAIP